MPPFLDARARAFLRARTKNRALHALHRLRLLRFREELVELDQGARFLVRAGTHDRGIVREVWDERAYPIERVPLGSDDAIVDVGAQIGTFSVLAARTPARVIALEPAPLNQALLRKNLELNDCSGRVEVHRLALGPEGFDEVDLFQSYTNTGGASILEPIGPRVRVPCVSLRALLVRFDLARLRLLKVDVEAGEYPIFYSTPPATLARLEHVFVEADRHPLMRPPDHPDWPEYSPAGLTSFLERHGFEVERIAGANTLHARRR